VGGNTVSTRIQSGTSQVNIAAPGGEIYMAVGGSNVFDITSAQTTLFGNLNPNGNNTQSLGNSTNRWSNLWISGNTIYIGGSNITANATTLSFGGSPIVTQNANGNISGGNITATTVSATGNITGGNLSVGNGTITAGNIVNSNSNTVGNIGSSSNYFNTVFAKATSALYADLAELYLADAEYSPGKVVSFGGEFEITGSNIDGDTKVAGIVSTNPSYLMNSGLTGKNIIAVTLQGRVPCSVTGTIRKGDMLVSNGDGSARAESNPSIGTVIGKALANFDGKIGIIEVVVGIR
jgi:hypothetical protein